MLFSNRKEIGICIRSLRWKIKAIHVKTALLQGKQIEQTVYVQAPKEANTTKIWKLQKGVYGLANASHYWYLYVREQLIKFGVNVSSVDSRIFYWKGNSPFVGILTLCDFGGR